MIKYRIFMVGFGGAMYCPFNLGFIEYSVKQDNYLPLYFDNIEQASEFIRESITEQNRDYVILPVVSL